MTRTDRAPAHMPDDNEEASNGRLEDSELSARSGVFLSGGNPSAPPLAEVRNNRINYRINGAAVAGAGDFGSALRAIVEGNEVTTTFANSGPTNPAAFRASPSVNAASNGTVDLVVRDNMFAGPASTGFCFTPDSLRAERHTRDASTLNSTTTRSTARWSIARW